ncbi:hypothetical protein TNCV_2629221 [Trichonephila clavipes]|uniref:Uncharacterized protein n=1 Tax=Trichonephila clavipes TaxID=2585209 RepID=A0A8X6SF00_TRICX|nr:hypothetical protein TNCV_2629221 [Trichonephila clavipes]
MKDQRYVHDILQPHVLPLMQRLAEAIFQQDSTRFHKTIPALSLPFLGLHDLQICLQSSISGIIWDEGDSDDVQELLDSNNQELTIDKLIEMHDQDIEELESLDPVQTKDGMTRERMKSEKARFLSKRVISGLGWGSTRRLICIEAAGGMTVRRMAHLTVLLNAYFTLLVSSGPGLVK